VTPSPELSHRTVAIVVTLAVAVMAASLGWMRGLVHDPAPHVLTLLGLAAFLFNVPALLSAWLARGPSTSVIALAAMVFLGLLGFLPAGLARGAGSVVACLGAAAFVLQLVAWRPRRLAQLGGRLVALAAAGLLGLWATAAAWGQGYVHPLLPERVLLGRGHIDSLYHPALANMFHTYGHPSTGLDGVPLVPYHVGSHLWFAQLGELVGLPLFTFYNQAVGLLVVPLFFFAILTLAVSARARYGEGSGWHPFTVRFWVAFGLGLVGFLPRAMAQATSIGWSPLASESYTMAVAIALLAGAAVVDRWPREPGGQPPAWAAFLLLVPVVVCGLVKVSVGYLVLGAGGYVALRTGQWRRPAIVAALVTGAALYYFVIMRAAGTSGHLEVMPFHFLRSYVAREWWPYYALLAYAWVWVYVARRVQAVGVTSVGELGRALLDGRLLDVEVVLAIAAAGALPGLVLAIPGGSAFYFSNVQVWLALALVLSVPGRGQGLLGARPAALGGLAIVALAVWAGAGDAWRFVRDFRAETRRAATEIVATVGRTPAERAAGLAGVLDRLARLPRQTRRESAVFVPQTNGAYWGLRPEGNPLSTPLLVPALTGMAMIDGLSDDPAVVAATRKWDYGFSEYRPRTGPQATDPASLCRRAQAMGARTVFVIPDATRVDELRCP
jgi:hypothetical protein